MRNGKEDSGIQLLQLVFLVFVICSTYIIILPYINSTPITFNKPNSNTNTENEEFIDSKEFDCPEEAAGYIEQLRVQTQENLANIATTGKFVIYQPNTGGGLGNRISALVATAIVALVTKRGFVVHWPNENHTINSIQEDLMMMGFSNLFEPPFPIDMLNIEGFNWKKMMNTTNTVRIVLEEDLTEAISCQDFVEIVGPEKRFIIMNGFRSYIDVFMLNPNYNPEITRLGLTISRIRQIGRCLLKPSKAVRDIIADLDRTYKRKPFQKMIGIHIRTISMHGLTLDQELSLWDCVLDRYPTPRCPREVPFNNASHVYYLASDTNETIPRAPEDVKPYLMHLKGNDITRTTNIGQYNALVDIWMLGRCDELFAARRTTYPHNVQMLFDTKLYLMPLFKTNHHQECKRVAELPCYMNWDPRSSNLTCIDTMNDTLIEQLRCD